MLVYFHSLDGASSRLQVPGLGQGPSFGIVLGPAELSAFRTRGSHQGDITQQAR